MPRLLSPAVAVCSVALLLVCFTCTSPLVHAQDASPTWGRITSDEQNNYAAVGTPALQNGNNTLSILNGQQDTVSGSAALFYGNVLLSPSQGVVVTQYAPFKISVYSLTAQSNWKLWDFTPSSNPVLGGPSTTLLSCTNPGSADILVNPAGELILLHSAIATDAMLTGSVAAADSVGPGGSCKAVIYATTAVPSYVYAIDAATGTISWSRPVSNYTDDTTANFAGSPAYYNNMLFVRTTQAHIICINTYQQGQLKWLTQLDTTSISQPTISIRGITATLYVSVSDGPNSTLTALDINGNIQNTVPLPTEPAHLSGVSASHNNLLFIPTYNGNVLLYNASSNVVTELPISQDSDTLSPITVADDLTSPILYVADYHGYAYAYDVNARTITWSQQLFPSESIIYPIIPVSPSSVLAITRKNVAVFTDPTAPPPPYGPIPAGVVVAMVFAALGSLVVIFIVSWVVGRAVGCFESGRGAAAGGYTQTE